MWSATFADLLEFSGPLAKLCGGHDGSGAGCRRVPQRASLRRRRGDQLGPLPLCVFVGSGSFVQQSSVLHETAQTLGATGSRLFTRPWRCRWRGRQLLVAWPLY